MSYILDALRKAERDRHLGRAPSLEDVTQPPPRRAGPSRSTRPLVLLGLVAVLAVLTVVFCPRKPHPAALTAPSGAADPSPAERPLAAAPALAAPRSEPPAASTPALDAAVPAESIDDLLDEPAPAVASNAADAVEINTPAAGAEREPAVAATPAADEADSAGPDQPLAEAEAATAPAPETEPATEPKLQPPSAAAVGVTALRDMPDAYRADFPDFRVDVHVYDDDPARRWAMINGNKYLEGATLPQGPRIAAITVDGIVFDYRGQTVLLPLRR